jgi:hypothetical protein
MAGGMKINDRGGYAHTSEGLMKSKNHLKSYSSASDAGAENSYEDTTEAIKKQQDMGASKAKAHPLKDGYRN